MEAVTDFVRALFGEPMALVMAIVALACAVMALSPGTWFGRRLATAALAMVSGMTAWMMVTRWRWPS
jgi:cell division protein FtsW (lipid II flippase)